MIHETVRYTVPSSAVPACRQAIRELVGHVKEKQPDTLFYTVLENTDDRFTEYLHLCAFESPDARQRHHESEALRLFTDLVYPATSDGIHFNERNVVDRLRIDGGVNNGPARLHR